ncbi:hypothetical protein [Kitasatospora sp. NPDC001095]
MSENNENEDFSQLLAGLEDQFGKALLVQRAETAVLVAEFSGAVYRAAVSSGVPAELAQAMAAGYWDVEMGEADPQDAAEEE